MRDRRNWRVKGSWEKMIRSGLRCVVCVWLAWSVAGQVAVGGGAGQVKFVFLGHLEGILQVVGFWQKREHRIGNTGDGSWQVCWLQVFVFALTPVSHLLSR